MQIPIKKLDGAEDLPTPAHAHAGDAGIDLRAAEESAVKAGEKKIISTGLAFAIPEGYVGLVWDKSGLAFKHGLTTLGGVIDASYRGEVKICIYNTSDTDYTFERKEKVAQLLVQPVAEIETKEVDSLDDTNRGEDGFGSTGKK